MHKYLGLCCNLTKQHYKKGIWKKAACRQKIKMAPSPIFNANQSNLGPQEKSACVYWAWTQKSKAAAGMVNKGHGRHPIAVILPNVISFWCNVESGNAVHNQSYTRMTFFCLPGTRPAVSPLERSTWVGSFLEIYMTAASQPTKRIINKKSCQRE